MGFRVWGLGFGVQGLGFLLRPGLTLRAPVREREREGLGFRVWALGFGV